MADAGRGEGPLWLATRLSRGAPGDPLPVFTSRSQRISAKEGVFDLRLLSWSSRASYSRLVSSQLPCRKHRRYSAGTSTGPSLSDVAWTLNNLEEDCLHSSSALDIFTFIFIWLAWKLRNPVASLLCFLGICLQCGVNQPTMLSSSSSQYLHPDYLQPLPTTVSLPCSYIPS